MPSQIRKKEIVTISPKHISPAIKTTFTTRPNEEQSLFRKKINKESGENDV